MKAVVLLLFAVAASSAHAQTDDASQDAEARQLYEAGVVAFEAGRYENALEAFQSAHELSGRPELLYNIGQSADRLRRNAAALDAFEGFVEARPDHPNAAAVRRRIEVLRTEVEAERERAEPSSVPIVLIAAGAAVLAGGAAVLGVGIADRNAIEDPNGDDWSDLESRNDRAQPMMIVGSIALGLGAAVLAAGIGWKASQPGAPDVAIGPGRVDARWRF